MFFQDVPYKSSNEFDVTFNFGFRSRIIKQGASESSNVKTSGPLPYVEATVLIRTVVNGEVRARVENPGGQLITSQKLGKNKNIHFDLGFADDLKDRTANHEFVIYLLSSEKMPVSRIVIHFDEDGSYYVNGARRGKV